MTLEECAADVLGPGCHTAQFTTRSFIRLGGDSLRAMRLVALAQERLGARIQPGALLCDTSLADVLHRAVPAADGPPRAPAPADATIMVGAVGDGDDPVSHTQRGMWLAEQVTGGSPYNLVFLAFAESPLNAAALAEAVGAAVARHDGLRTVFLERDDSVIRHVLHHYTPHLATLEHDGPVAEFRE